MALLFNYIKNQRINTFPTIKWKNNCWLQNKVYCTSTYGTFIKYVKHIFHQQILGPMEREELN